MPSSSSKRALCLLTLLLSAPAALAQNPPPPQQPYQGLPIRIGTWNIHPTRIGPQSPDDRLRDVVNFARNNNVDVLALQEVPRALLEDTNRMAAFSNVVQAQGYGMLTAAEYPSGTRAPTSARQNAYVVLYNPTHLTPVPPPAPASAALTFYQEDRFVQGLAQARPPVQLQFNVHHPNNHGDTTLNFLTWHNEAGTMARPHMAELYNLIQRDLQARATNNHEDFAVVGDFNVQETVPEVRRIDARNRLAHEDGIDHIVANVPVTNVINDNTTNPIDPQFRSSGRHLILFAEFPVGKQ